MTLRTDPELSDSELHRALRTAGRGAETTLLKWQHGKAGLRYAVVVCPDAGDKYTEHPLSDAGRCEAGMAERTPCQRDNRLLAIGDDLREVLWNAENHVFLSQDLTLWFDEKEEKYHVLPRCRREGPTGIPVLAPYLQSGIIVPA